MTQVDRRRNNHQEMPQLSSQPLGIQDDMAYPVSLVTIGGQRVFLNRDGLATDGYEQLPTVEMDYISSDSYVKYK